MREVLYQFNPWWEGEYTAPGIRRGGYLDLLGSNLRSRDIIFLVGLRRTGKTTILHHFIADLLKTKNPRTIMYLSLDHPAFIGKTMVDILREYRAIHGLERAQPVYLFLDEIHLKQGFERDLKVLYDMEKVKIFASGSSSLVVRHKGAYLTGRSRKLVVEPLSFPEYLDFKGIRIKPSEEYMADKHLLDYMKAGGMPENVLRHDPVYLMELVEGLIYKDIVARYGIQNPSVLNELLLLLAERVGSRLTYNKLSKILHLSPDTVKGYVSYLEETFLVHIIPKCSPSLNERTYSPKKIYFADVGIRNALTGFKDMGALAENLVFLKIKDRGNVCYRHEHGKEVDFIVGKTAIEVKFKDLVEPGDVAGLSAMPNGDKLLVARKAGRTSGIPAVSLCDFLMSAHG
jgi:hypothetical protein